MIMSTVVDSILLSITGASTSVPPWISLHRGSIEVKTVKKVLPRKKASQTSAETRKKNVTCSNTREIPLTNRVLGPYCKLRTDVFWGFALGP